MVAVALIDFYAGSGDDIVNFGVDENGNGTHGRYYSEAGNDNLNMNDEWAWLHYDYEEETATTPVLVNFSDQVQVIDGKSALTHLQYVTNTMTLILFQILTKEPISGAVNLTMKLS